jgi:hypothetical protein
MHFVPGKLCAFPYSPPLVVHNCLIVVMITVEFRCSQQSFFIRRRPAFHVVEVVQIYQEIVFLFDKLIAGG